MCDSWAYCLHNSLVYSLHYLYLTVANVKKQLVQRKGLFGAMDLEVSV